MGNKVACPECGNKYKSVGQHWANSSNCQYPKPTKYQEEIITGLMMGDGYMETSNKNPRLQTIMTSPNYLEYVRKKFGVLGTDVRLYRTGEKAKEYAEKYDNSIGSNKDSKFKDQYQFTTRSLPSLEKFVGWYSTGEKVFPENIELTPTVLKHWYCGDGNRNDNNKNNYIQITICNEYVRKENIEKMLKRSGLPKPQNYGISVSEDRVGDKPHVNAIWTVEQSKKLWNYMGEPLPDFEYKWPEQYR